MWLFVAFGGLCRLRKHGSNCPGLAGELKYFCNSSVIYELAGHRACDTARVNDHGLSLEGITPEAAIATGYDCAVITTHHASFDYDRIANASPLVVDTRNALKGRKGSHIFRL